MIDWCKFANPSLMKLVIEQNKFVLWVEYNWLFSNMLDIIHLMIEILLACFTNLSMKTLHLYLC